MKTSITKRWLTLKMMAKLIDLARQEGISFIVSWFHRTPEQQDALYQIGRTRPGKVITNCDGYTKVSTHQLWEAFDIAVIKDGAITFEAVPAYKTLGDAWQSWGCTWGGGPDGLSGDIYHFELGDYNEEI